MSPEERQLLVDLFDRTRQASSNPRDREAESFISDQVRSQPYAPYLLAQTVIVQDQALRAANERLQQLEQRLRETRGRRQPAWLGRLPRGPRLPVRWWRSQPAALVRAAVPLGGRGSPRRCAPRRRAWLRPVLWRPAAALPRPGLWRAMGRWRALPAARRRRRVPQGRSWRRGGCRWRRSDGRFHSGSVPWRRQPVRHRLRLWRHGRRHGGRAWGAAIRSSTITMKAAIPPLSTLRMCCRTKIKTKTTRRMRAISAPATITAAVATTVSMSENKRAVPTGTALLHALGGRFTSR